MHRIDLYTAIHKSLRAALFRLSERAGAADFTDEAAVARLNADLCRLTARLRAHLRNEERFIHPVLAERAPELLGSLDGAHATYVAMIDTLEAAFASARAARSPEAGLAFYRAWNRFIAENLAHFDEEERGMTTIWERCSDADLAEIMGAFNASRTPEEALSDLEDMLPALSHPERRAILGGMRAKMPAEAFATVRAVVGRVLDEEARRRLVDVIG